MIVVDRASLAGVAAAVRLAKVGHTVRLVDPAGMLHGDPESLASHWQLPQEFVFPAPLRDLFRKSGRILDAELGRSAHQLVSVPSRTVPVPGQEPLVYPTERGAQFTALSERFGTATATQWRDLLDGLADVWQARRALGLEHELTAETLQALRPRLLWGRTVGELADTLAHPVLSALIIDSGRGENPENPRQAPASEAIWLTVERTFGRWRIVSEGAASGDAGSPDAVSADAVSADAVSADSAPRGTASPPLPAPITGPAIAAALQRRLTARRVEVVGSDDGAGDVAARVLAGGQPPLLSVRRSWRPASWRRSVRAAEWYERPGPRVRGAAAPDHSDPPQYVCGAHTPSGPGFHGQILSAALVAYAAHIDLTGKNIHPTYKGP